MVTRRVVILAATVLVALFAAAIAYATSAGHLDRSFGRHGVAIVHYARGFATSAAVGTRNRIVVAGDADQGAFTIARLFSKGSVEKRFGQRGIVTVDFGTDSARATSVAIGRHGGIVATGTVCSDRETCHFGIVRLLRDGAIDRQFGNDGTVEVDFAQRYGFDPTVALGPHGRIVVGGSDCASSRVRDCDIAIAALRRDGTLDPEFGDGGKVLSSFSRRREGCPKSYLAGSPRGMDIDSHGRIVVGGMCQSGKKAALARFTRTGELDQSFGRKGRIERYLNIGRVRALTVDDRDRIDVVGELGPAVTVARFASNSELDRSFGGNGRARIRFARDQESWSRKHHVSPHSVAVDSHGRIVIGGSHAGGFAFARFKRDGHADGSFGHGGRVVVTGGTKDLVWTGTVAVDSRDRIIGSGAGRISRNANHRHFALVRLLG
jgi:uncharacterized delta-60 repeat protein